jgi:hypothetical protein
MAFAPIQSRSKVKAKSGSLVNNQAIESLLRNQRINGKYARPFTVSAQKELDKFVTPEAKLPKYSDSCIDKGKVRFCDENIPKEKSTKSRVVLNEIELQKHNEVMKIYFPLSPSERIMNWLKW